MNSSTGVTSIKASLAKVGNFVEKHKAAVMVTTMVAFMFLMVIASQSYADSIWNVAENASTSLITNIKNLYCKTIFPLGAVLALIAMVLTKDEKKLAVEKRALITLIIVFIAIYGVYVIRDTVLGLATQVEGSSGGV